MKRCKIFLARVLSIVLVFGMLLTGCSTTQHGIAINNVSSVREVYIKNAGASNWGPNIAGNLQNIDVSRYSESIDIKVIDANGAIYSKYNVPFDDNAFAETGKERYMGTGTSILMGALGAVAAVTIIIVGRMKNNEK